MMRAVARAALPFVVTLASLAEAAPVFRHAKDALVYEKAACNTKYSPCDGQNWPSSTKCCDEGFTVSSLFARAAHDFGKN